MITKLITPFLVLGFFVPNYSNRTTMQPQKTFTEQTDSVSIQTSNTISFSANGTEVVTRPQSIGFFEMKGVKGVNIGSKMTVDKPTIQFNLNGRTATAYNLKDCKGNIQCGSFGNYLPTNNPLKGYYVFTSGKVVVTAIDPVKKTISASFEGEATGKDGTVKISNGRIINCKLNTTEYKF